MENEKVIPVESGLKVKVTAYGGRIVIEPIDILIGVGGEWVPVDCDPCHKFGSVLCDCTSRVGISDQALELMKKIEIGHDCIFHIFNFQHSKSPRTSTFATHNMMESTGGTKPISIGLRTSRGAMDFKTILRAAEMPSPPGSILSPLKAR